MTSQFELKGKVAIVTGSGRGIGKGIAVELAKAGADVVVCSRTQAEIETTADEIRSLGRKTLAVVVDVRQKDQVVGLMEKTRQELGHIDILVNNAGGSFRVPALEMSERAWDAIIGENLKPVFLCSQAAAKIMLQQKKGNIINISSISGLGPSPLLCAYGAAKAGINNLTQTLAVEWAPYGIRVNAIAPGPIETQGFRDTTPPETLAEITSRIPLSRLGQPEDVARVVIFLASEASGWITGFTIDLCGGPASLLMLKE